MTKDEVCSRIREIAIIPAIRAASGPDAHFAAEAVTRGGISIVEITMTIPGAVELMAHLVRSNPKLIVGAGTVLDTDTARLCVDAGVSFVTAPSLDPAILEFAAKENIVVVPGALTPTEVVTAWRAGADFIKVFPCGPGWRRRVHQGAARIPATGSIDRSGRSESTDRGQLHFVRCDRNRGWHGIDSNRGDSKKAIAAHSRIGPPLRKTGERCTRTDRGVEKDSGRKAIHRHREM